MDEIALKIRDIIGKYIAVDESKAATPLSELDIDSLDLVEAMMDIETEYGIEFSQEEIANLKCFNDIVEQVKAKKQK